VDVDISVLGVERWEKLKMGKGRIRSLRDDLAEPYEVKIVELLPESHSLGCSCPNC